MKTDLQATVKDIDKQKAVLVTTDQQTIDWPLASLPDDVKVGDTVTLELHSQASEQERNQTIAKAILNEILSDK